MPRAVGRPTVYDPKLHPKLVKALAIQGKTVEEIAEEMEISSFTIYKWAREHEEFSLFLKEGRDSITDRVESALIRSALGYDQEVEKPMVVSSGNGMGSEVEIVRYTEKVAPNVTAQKMYLINRRPEQWREKSDVNLSGAVETVTMTHEERMKLKKELEDKLKNG